MYDLSDIKKGVHQPYLIFRELNGLISRRFGLDTYYPEGVDVFEADWDNMIILDACRYDVFSEHADLPGETDSRYSRASATEQFIRANFSNRQLHDVVYVAGNSWFLRLRDEIESEVHAIYDVADNSDRDKLNRLTECAINCANEYPNKRLLIHFIPPHHPFVGPTADEHFPPYENQLNDLFNRIQRGDVDVTDKQLRQAYRENLDRVLPKIQELLDSLIGKTVVAADHGELLGERLWPIPVKGYGHPKGLHVEELLRVPWHVFEDGERRATEPDEPILEPDNSYSSTDKSVEERLRDLGYKVT